MKWYSWLWRGVIALLGLMLTLSVGWDIYSIVIGKLPVAPFIADALLFDIWVVSWIVAALWSRPATSSPPALDQTLHWTPTLVGFALISFGAQAALPGDRLLWHVPDALGWGLAAACAAGLAFTWWARISLGSLWSASVTRKNDHTVVQSGPYRLVRHPIYTGLILATFACAIEIGMLSVMIGALLITFGFWLKAGLEERFLSRELGEAAYADYRRRTPMLVPFWPA